MKPAPFGSDPTAITSQLAAAERAELEGIRRAREAEDQAALLRELRSYAHELLPNAPERLAENECRDLARFREPGRLAKAVCEYIRGPYCERFRKLSGPGSQPSDDPLRSVLNRHKDALKDGALEKLYNEMALDYARRPEPEIAEAVARKLADYRSNGYLRRALEPPREVQNVRAALELFAHQLKAGAVAELAERWSGDAGGLPHDALAALVATRLGLPMYRDYLDVDEFDPKDRPWPKPGVSGVGRATSPGALFGAGGASGATTPPHRPLAKI